MFAHPEAFRCLRFEDLPEYPDEFLRSVRDRTEQVEREVVTGRSISAGDQITFHYELALLSLAQTCGCWMWRPAPDGAPACSPSAAVRSTPPISTRRRDRGRRDRAGTAQFALSGVRLLGHARRGRVLRRRGYRRDTGTHPGWAVPRRVERVLAPDGVLIASTPQNRFGHIPLIPAHTHEFSLDELRELVDRFFDIEVIYGLKAGAIFSPAIQPARTPWSWPASEAEAPVSGRASLPGPLDPSPVARSAARAPIPR